MGAITTTARIYVSGASANCALSLTPLQSGGAFLGPISHGTVGMALVNSTANTYLTVGVSNQTQAATLSNTHAGTASHICIGSDTGHESHTHTYTANYTYAGTANNAQAGRIGYLPAGSFGLADRFVTSVFATTDGPSIQSEGYRALSETLCELSNSNQDDEWHIDSEVYDTSIQVAAALFDQNIPTPHVFSHGPKSVVFNWDDGDNNLYLTVGKRRLWVAVSSAAEIKTRLELTGPGNNVAGDFLTALGQSFTNKRLLRYDLLSDSA